MGPRFLTLYDVEFELNCTLVQAYALVRSGELAATKVGGAVQWRIERAALEEYIAAAYASTRAFVAEHPFPAGTRSQRPPAYGSIGSPHRARLT